MRFSKRTLSALSTILPITATRAFVSTQGHGGAFASRSNAIANTSITSIPRGGNHRSISSTTSVSMIFEQLFGGGGAFNAKIDYSAIPYPCPDLASFALEGKALKNGDLQRDGKEFHVATFAGGCFWGLELAFQRVPGVEYTTVGYTHGPQLEPTYNQVCSGTTGHTEAVIVLYDPNECSYQTLLDTFFGRVNPLTVNGQGNDRGTQYRTGVYTHSEEQKELAEKQFEALKAGPYKGKKIATECMDAAPFWPAEKYHQQYLEKGGQSAAKECTQTIRCYG